MNRRLILTGVLAFAVFMGMQIPAAYVLQPVATGGRLAADGLSGSLLHGRAGALQLGDITLSSVEWRLDWLPLLWGRLAFDTRFAVAGGGGEAEVGCGLFGGCGAEDLHAAVPLPALAGELPQLAALEPAGALQVNLDEVAFDDAGLSELAGVVAVQDLTLGPPWDLDLGTLEAQIARDGEGFTGALADRGGPLELSGSLRLTPDGAYDLDARLRPREQASPKLRQALQGLGQPDAEGRYTLSYRGSLD